MTQLARLIVFVDPRLAERYADRPLPMATFVSAYIDGRIDVQDIDALLDARHDVVSFDLTPAHFKFLFGRMVSEWLVHSKSQDGRIVRDHYDRGDDFFEAFLGETMVYTSGFFEDSGETLERAQHNKMDRVCRKLQLRAGEQLLDIGCGWGTLAIYAARHFGAKTTGVTLAPRGAAFANARISREGLESEARVLCLDYRELPAHPFDRIVSLEMVEHVGIKNLPRYFDIVRERLKDDGLFLMQWCGVRGLRADGLPPLGMRAEDKIWGLFMNENIFSGADASLPLGAMLQAMEKAGFEIESVENVSVHYVMTIQKWHENWLRNREKVLQTYGERWFRLWNVFLAWSWRVGLQGTSACFQVLAHKNLDSFDRRASFQRKDAPPSGIDPGVAAE